ncbi:MAG: hypothetical protein D3910_10630, partial [Candidatus Electrothrix sp. ATG2]|nr:hypothetical protein [Candidatus Electrothrix sp. ATG2]
ISIDDIGDIKTDWGVIRPVGEGISELVPRHSSVTRISGKQYRLGFVLESTYPYKVNFTDEAEDRKSPKEINDAAKRINETNENISFCFSLACDRNPPVGMSLAWTMVFDPINHGTQVTSNSIRRSPMPFYLVRDTKESDALIEWSKRIKKTDDKNIQLAIKRILSAINERTNPIDSFIDTVIAWENLFGANAELGFRISVSIAKLLGETEAQIKGIQKKVNDYYNKRSKIVHGVNEVTNEEAINFREECLDITLKVIRKLYTEKVELINIANSAERSKELAIV